MNIYEHHKGRQVMTIDSDRPGNMLDADFPGWGAPDYADHMTRITGGIMGTIETVDSHGIAPHTRYYVRLENGARIVGAVLGHDIAWPDGSTDQRRYGTAC